MNAYIVDYTRQNGSKGRALFERHTDEGAKLHIKRLCLQAPTWRQARLHKWQDKGWQLIDTIAVSAV